MFDSYRQTKMNLVAIVTFLISVFDLQSVNAESLSGMCTMIGCDPGTSIYIDVPGTYEDLRESKLRICQNWICRTVSFKKLDIDPPRSGEGKANRLSSNGNIFGFLASADVTVWTSKSGKQYLHIKWRTWKHKNGDSYMVELINKEGGKAVSLSEKTTYSEFYPNGKGCDPTPCWSALIDKSAAHNESL